ncbi:MAG: hypothetical protein V3S69_07585, partial [Dehalococcoidales bacterium]
LEPVFLNKAQMNVRQMDDTFKPYTAYDYGYRLYCSIRQITLENNPGQLPPYMVTHEDLSVDNHIEMQAACQNHIDASVSKTINCPQDMTFEQFQDLYIRAYNLRTKGCTSYRYSEVRGSILSSHDEEKTPEILVRPEVLSGRTYKVKWPSVDENYYITINDVGNDPFEVFIQSTSSKYTDWTTALSLMISAIMRKGGDISFIPEELAKVRSADDSAWVEGKFYGSLVAVIGDTIGRHLLSGDSSSVEEASAKESTDTQVPRLSTGDTCPQCNQPQLIQQEGCMKCMNCTYSNCG